MAIIRNFRKERFTSISNDLLSDTSISFKAKGLLCYLVSRPPNWNVNVNHLSSTFNVGKDGIYSTLNELIERGYVKRKMTRNDQGRVDSVEYHVYEEPLRAFPCVDNPDKENPDNNNNRVLVNTEDNNGGENSPNKKPEKKEVTLRDRKIQFLKTIIDFIATTESKYPKLMYMDFAKYWLEGSVKKKVFKMRFEDQQFFDIGRRLSTWFQKANDQVIQKYWDKEQQIGTINELFKTLL